MHDDSLLSGLPEIVSFPNKISDHSAIVCTADIPKPCATTRTSQCRKVRNIDLDLWNKDLKDSALYNSDLNACADPNVLTDQYHKVLSNLIELHAPVRPRTVTLRPHSPWYDDNLRSLKRAKLQAERTYVKSVLEVHRQIFEDQCRICSDALNSAEQEYYKNQISGSDQKQLFRLIDGLFKVKPAPLLPSCDSPQGLSEKFATFFSEKNIVIRDSLHSSVLAMMDLSVTPSQPLCQTTFCDFSAVSVRYISELLVKSNTKSCILDPAPTSVLKHSIEALAPAITSIVNASLLSGVFPSSLKKGVIHLWIKKLSHDREAYLSYFPITNVAFLSKMLERVAATQTLNYLIHNGLLAKFQSAYRCFNFGMTPELIDSTKAPFTVHERQQVESNV